MPKHTLKSLLSRAGAADRRDEQAEQVDREDAAENIAMRAVQGIAQAETVSRLKEMIAFVYGLECTCARDGIGTIRAQCVRCRILERAGAKL